jgi:ABC-2 type transport system permease protein
MMRTLFGRTLYEKRWFIAGWALTYALMSALVMFFYPSFSAEGSFDKIVSSMPEELRGFIGDPSVFRTVQGYITSQVYDVRMSLIIIIAALVLATGLTVKEEETGDLRTTLSTSLSRNRIVLEKFLAAGFILAVLNLCATAGIYIALASLAETMPHMLIWQCFGLSCLFSLTTFSIPFAIALATGKRGITMVVGLFVAIGSYILTTFARSVDWLKNWDALSLIHYFDTDGLRTGDFGRWNIWVLCLITIAALLFGIVRFRKRDVT